VLVEKRTPAECYVEARTWLAAARLSLAGVVAARRRATRAEALLVTAEALLYAAEWRERARRARASAGGIVAPS